MINCRVEFISFWTRSGEINLSFNVGQILQKLICLDLAQTLSTHLTLGSRSFIYKIFAFKSMNKFMISVGSPIQSNSHLVVLKLPFSPILI